MQIGEQIRLLREREGISQSALARALGATRAAVNAWEMGVSNPSMQSLVELALYFHVSVDHLLGLDNSDRVSLASLTPDEKELVLKLIRHFDRERNV